MTTNTITTSCQNDIQKIFSIGNLMGVRNGATLLAVGEMKTPLNVNVYTYTVLENIRLHFTTEWIPYKYYIITDLIALR